MTKVEIRTADYLRIITDLVSANNDVANRLNKAAKYAKVVQSRLNIPDRQEVAIGILAVLFSHSSIYAKVSFTRLKMKMGLLDLHNPLVVEDFIYLINNKYITLEKSVENIKYISITDKLYNHIWNYMTEENRKLFLLLAGKELNEAQLKYLKSKLFNEGLDIGELFLTAVSCGQIDAAKIIIDFGWDMNKEGEIMAYELFICSNYNSSKFCVDFYLANGLKITDNLISEMIRIGIEHQDNFDIDNILKLVEELKIKKTDK